MGPFSRWLGGRVEEIPDAMSVALAIAQAGAAGISRDDLARALGHPPETSADVLKALVATGQVVVLKVDEQMTYRAAM
jgi:hypothetical protein